jgi:hypothetical protein
MVKRKGRRYQSSSTCPFTPPVVAGPRHDGFFEITLFSRRIVGIHLQEALNNLVLEAVISVVRQEGNGGVGGHRETDKVPLSPDINPRLLTRSNLHSHFPQSPSQQHAVHNFLHADPAPNPDDTEPAAWWSANAHQDKTART